MKKLFEEQAERMRESIRPEMEDWDRSIGSSKKSIPQAHRPLYLEYKTIGQILNIWNEQVYNLAEEEFVGKCMQISGGGMSVFNARIVYKQLMKEAGV